MSIAGFRTRLEMRPALRLDQLDHRIPGRGGDDRGLSLIELMVAMFVASILFGGIATVFAGTLRATRTVNTKTATGADLRLSIESMSRSLKVAYVPYGESSAFTAFSSTGISFYALLNRTGAASTAEPIPTLVTYSYASNCLTETQTPGVVRANPAVGGPYFDWTSGTTSKCLLRTTTAPVFTYYTDATGTTQATATTDIRSVALNLTATDPNNPTISGVPAQTRISLENLINADGSS